MVRADLHRNGAAGTHIAQIAARYGFSEPGRFSVEYRSVFGETPSTTVRRSSIALRDTISAEFA
jgi:AraC-like DNA-binding protein